jgi:hypothetical protein
LIGGNVDLDLVLQIPQIDSTSMGGIESRESFFKVNNGGEREWEEATAQGERRGPFIVLSKFDHYLHSGSTAAPSDSTALQKPLHAKQAEAPSSTTG